MPYLLWDACTLVKRFFAETGSATVDALFDAVPSTSHHTTAFGYVETAAILRRNFNRGEITQTDFLHSRANFRQEVLLNPDFIILPMDNDLIFAGLDFSDRYNVNSTDAAILSVFLEYSRSLEPTDPPCVLITSDHRLIRAATAEGLTAFDPEAYAPDDVLAFLAQLSGA